MDNGLYKNLREKLIYQETLDLDEEGVREKLTDLVDRDSPMKPIKEKNGDCDCPICNSYVEFSDVNTYFKHEFCPGCGQKLDWED